MIKFEIKADFKKLQKEFENLAKKQIPFATAKTLTDLAGKVNKAAIDELGKSFILRNKYVKNSFRKVMAKKSDWPHCQSQAGSIAPFMGLQVRGGEKTHKQPTKLGVPVGARPHQSDVISKPMWVKNLLRKSGYLQVTSKSGKELLLMQKRAGKRRNKKRNSKRIQRVRRSYTGKRGWKRDTIYVLKDSVKIPARFEFDKIAERTIAENAAPTFIKNLSEALKKN